MSLDDNKIPSRLFDSALKENSLDFTVMLEFLTQCTEVHFASLLSGRFSTMAVINPPEKKLATHTSVHRVAGLIVSLTKCLMVQ